MNARTRLLCGLFLAVTAWPAAAQDAIFLKRLVKAPESIEETFYRFENNEADVKGSVIQKVALNYEAGKGGGELKMHYKNHTRADVVPGFVIRLYNPFGVCMGGFRVSEDNMNTPKPIAPGESGVTLHRFGIFRMEAYIRHGVKDKLPADFTSLAWVSISQSNTVLVEKRPEIRRFELLNKE